MLRSVAVMLAINSDSNTVAGGSPTLQLMESLVSRSSAPTGQLISISDSPGSSMIGPAGKKSGGSLITMVGSVLSVTITARV